MDEKMQSGRKSVLSFGEVLWDVYPQYKKLGGAPFNVVAHLRQLGFPTAILTRIGRDDLGEEILAAIRKVGVDDKMVQEDDHLPTGTVAVSLDAAGKPTYEIVAPVAWDAIDMPGDEQLLKYHVLIYGTLAARQETSRNTLYALLRHPLFRVCDLNLRGSFYSMELIDHLVSEAHILKLNDEECEVVSELLNVPADEVFSALLNKHADMQMIVMTRGAHGALVQTRQGLVEHPGYQIKVVDTVGSGDAFLAGFVSQYLHEASIAESLDFACRLGAYVATCEGAIPRYTNVPDLPLNTDG